MQKIHNWKTKTELADLFSISCTISSVVFGKEGQGKSCTPVKWKSKQNVKKQTCKIHTENKQGIKRKIGQVAAK